MTSSVYVLVYLSFPNGINGLTNLLNPFYYKSTWYELKGSTCLVSKVLYFTAVSKLQYEMQTYFIVRGNEITRNHADVCEANFHSIMCVNIQLIKREFYICQRTLTIRTPVSFINTEANELENQ